MILNMILMSQDHVKINIPRGSDVAFGVEVLGV